MVGRASAHTSSIVVQPVLLREPRREARTRSRSRRRTARGVDATKSIGFSARRSRPGPRTISPSRIARRPRCPCACRPSARARPVDRDNRRESRTARTVRCAHGRHAAPTMSCCEARGLVKDYRRARAVDGVDLVVHAGERVALLGPNGAGKTTTLLMLLGVVSPGRGRRRRSAGSRSRGSAARPRVNVGFAAGYLPLTERMRVREYLTLYGQLYGIADPTPEIEEGLERFRITHLGDAMGTELSSGQRTLIGIVRATLHRPRLLVLDEPTASLDPDVALRVRTGLLDLSREYGTALLMTSHDMSDVETVCERVVFLSYGRVVADGAPRRGRVRPRAAAISKACSSTSPNATRRRQQHSRAITRDRRCDPDRVRPAARHRGNDVASARDLAPPRVRAGPQPAPPVRRDAVAARRRVAVRRAGGVRRQTAIRPARRRPSAICSPGSCCGTSSTSRRSR